MLTLLTLLLDSYFLVFSDLFVSVLQSLISVLLGSWAGPSLAPVSCRNSLFSDHWLMLGVPEQMLSHQHKNSSPDCEEIYASRFKCTSSRTGTILIEVNIWEIKTKSRHSLQFCGKSWADTSINYFFQDFFSPVNDEASNVSTKSLTEPCGNLLYLKYYFLIIFNIFMKLI